MSEKNKKQIDNSVDDDLRSFAQRAEGFKIDQNDVPSFFGNNTTTETSENSSFENEDFSKLIRRSSKKKRKKIVIISSCVTVFVLAIGFVMYSSFETNTASASSKNPASKERFLSLYPNAPATDPMRAVTGVPVDNGVSIPGGYTLVVPGVNFSSVNYTATAEGDFGVVTKSENNENIKDVYVFKNIVNSKAFSNVDNWEQVKIQGAVVSAVMLMTFPDGVHPVVAVVNPDSTGFMIVIGKDQTINSAKKLTETVNIQKT